VVELIAKFSGTTEVRGLEQLGSTKVTFSAQDVPARDALQRMLDCLGFTYREEGAALAIVPLGPQQTAPACDGGVHVANN